jgi:hypothetical protein
MPLTKEQFEELTLALVAAFPRQGDLDMMVKFKLGAFLNTVTAENNPYKVQVFQLVQWADAQDRVDDLVAGALNLNERNKALRSIAKKLQLDEGAGVNIGIGTGFLVGGSVAITNKHVIETIPGLGSAPVDIVLRFDYKMKGQTEIQEGVTYRLDSTNPILETSEVAALDFALLNVDGSPAQGSVAGQPGAPARGWLKPVAYQFQINDPIFIVQHPKASPLKFAPGSVNDPSPTVNRVGYTTNTEKGSSGSPCCTADWKVVALHHWGGPSHNRGVRFSAILDYLAPKHVSGFLTD